MRTTAPFRTPAPAKGSRAPPGTALFPQYTVPMPGPEENTRRIPRTPEWACPGSGGLAYKGMEPDRRAGEDVLMWQAANEKCKTWAARRRYSRTDPGRRANPSRSIAGRLLDGAAR